MITGLADAYSATSAAWQDGPSRIYDGLAEVLVAAAPLPLTDSHVLDVGAGTGAATRASLAAGAARVTAVDAALGMLSHAAESRPPAAVADLLAVPFADGAFDAAVAAFSLNHVCDPATGLREMSRVTRTGGVLLASAYAEDDAHPVKRAVEEALAIRGWRPEPWFAALRSECVPLLATVDGAAAALQVAGLQGDVELIKVPFPNLGAADLVAWRLGMAQHAGFAATLAPPALRSVADDATSRLGPDVEPLVRSIVVLRAINP